MPAIETENSSRAAMIREFGRPPVHIGANENESPWVPWQPGVHIRHLSFDVRSNSFTNILWVAQGGMLGRHRHRGPVFGYVLEGSWRYLEHDWIARPGDYIGEPPGAVHTLVSDDPNGMKTLFWLNGSLEFLADDGQVAETFDVFWFIDHYVSYCRGRNLKINEQLWI
jgi:quercetin dioxygenase-like cupin family protein